MIKHIYMHMHTNLYRTYAISAAGVDKQLKEQYCVSSSVDYDNNLPQGQLLHTAISEYR